MMRICLIVMLFVTACGKAKEVPPPPTPSASTTPAAFWKWFSDNAEALRSEKDLKNTMDRISAELEKTHHGVFAEIGGDGDNRMLVLSVDGKRDLFPRVQELYAARPTVKGWTIVAFRQRAKPGDPQLTIEMGGQKIEPSQVKFVGKPAAGKLDIDVFIPAYTTDDEMGQIGFVILDHTVGEFDMETKIGAIEFAALAKAPKDAKPLAELPAMVDALK